MSNPELDNAVAFVRPDGQVTILHDFDGPYMLWCSGPGGCESRWFVVRGSPSDGERAELARTASGLSYSLAVIERGAVEVKCPLCGRALPLR